MTTLTLTLTHNEKLQMAAAMKKHGGSFVVALSECFVLADWENLQRLCVAFPEYIETYRALGQKDAAAEGNQE